MYQKLSIITKNIIICWSTLARPGLLYMQVLTTDQALQTETNKSEQLAETFSKLKTTLDLMYSTVTQ